MAKRPALGRGLSSILGDVDEAYGKELGFGDTEEVSISDIEPNPYQPRKDFKEESLKELAASIERYGLIQPVVLVKKNINSYILVAGERRLRACKMLGMSSVKSVILKENENKLRELALIENIQRENLNPIELAISYKSLIDEYGLTQETLADIMHKSRTQITNTMRLLNLSDRTKDFIISGKLSQGHAKILVGLDKENEARLVDSIIGQNLTVRESEKLIQNSKNKTDKKTPITKETDFSVELKKLKQAFENIGVKCSVKQNKISLTVDNLDKIKYLNKILQWFFKKFILFSYNAK